VVLTYQRNTLSSAHLNLHHLYTKPCEEKGKQHRPTRPG
jgi:hypothetical protein